MRCTGSGAGSNSRSSGTSAPEGASLQVRVDGGAPRVVQVDRPTLYTLLDGDSYGEHLLEFEASAPGLSLFSATFG